VQKRSSSALLAFSKALTTRERREIIHPFQQIVYGVRLSLSLLLKQQPKESFRHLHPIIPCCPRFPYLWLRHAERCVLYFRQRVVKLTGFIAQTHDPTRTYTVLPKSDTRWAEADDVGATTTLECARMAVELSGENQGFEQK
jgi:hypothetical protein